MKKILCYGLPMVVVLLVSVLLSSNLYAAPRFPAPRKIEPIVSTEWLEANHNLENLVLVDMRTAAEYNSGHIPGSINVPFEVPFSAWVTMIDDLLLELPDPDSLFRMIGSCSITNDSLVVIVTSFPAPPEPPYPLANATRAAATLIYAGLKNVAILDGGYTKWAAEARPSTTEAPFVQGVEYQGQIRRDMFVSKEELKRRGRPQADLIDARDADVYFGVTIEPYANKAGHIPNAKSLPTPWIWNQDGTYKPMDELAQMASGILNEGRHRNKNREIIVYCGTGGYATAWWFVLSEMLGYNDVKIYDGSAQEWVRENEMTKYTWSE
ncbi:MAG TPA: hypothetical protein DDZ55_02660 [Firmicutes bacterium]|nr:hypothetical protein [Bacillota bacterium]